MQLKQGWLGISGTVQDDPRAGFPEQGIIKGKLRKGSKGEDVFVFEKIMPMLRIIHESGMVTLEVWADRRKVVMDTKLPHPKIRHIGDISADGNTMEGTFLMEEEAIPVPGSHESLMLPRLAGTFKLTRVAE